MFSLIILIPVMLLTVNSLWTVNWHPKLQSGTIKKTVGWVGDKRVVFSIDLSTVQAIKGIAVHTGGGKSGVEWPSAILVYTSDDGKNFSMIANLIDKNTIPKIR